MAEIVIVGNTDNNEPKDFSKGYLTIPFDGDQFKNFISSLLGKPQSIKRNIYGLFEIDMGDIQNFFELVNQRISQQNKGQLVQFVAQIHFSDDSSVQLGGYEELLTYNEVKPIVSTAITLTWIYLIQFSDKSYPEKQAIELMISAGKYNEDGFLASRFRGFGSFSVVIDHTARSWGFDMENVISTQIHSLLKNESKFKNFVRRNKDDVSTFFALTLFFICLTGSFITANSFIESELAKVKTFSQGKNYNLNEKMNFLISYVASGSAAKFYFYVVLFLVLAAIASIFASLWIAKEAEVNYESSFLILTKKSKEYRDQTVKRLNNNWIKFLIATVCSIIVGLISNYIFKILVE